MASVFSVWRTVHTQACQGHLTQATEVLYFLCEHKTMPWKGRQDAASALAI